MRRVPSRVPQNIGGGGGWWGGDWEVEWEWSHGHNSLGLEDFRGMIIVTPLKPPIQYLNNNSTDNHKGSRCSFIINLK